MYFIIYIILYMYYIYHIYIYISYNMTSIYLKTNKKIKQLISLLKLVALCHHLTSITL